ncbi:hypothetical protein QTP70_012824 [Hemibagrus guttatus]|uniref:Voltage-dependent calcium channel gamma-2 subunit n=1 Tax=Hemibagrus guttatus TaxID=175788 RepID=A0AAE0QG85_9TELE|nr:hypothetical protein QTP70_012824 [Hemibagrus guttatus]
MGTFDRGVQMLLSTVGAFAAFSLMTIAVGTDYWLYSRGVCKIKTTNENETSKKNEEVMTHSGLWRTCCLEAKKKVDVASNGHLQDLHYRIARLYCTVISSSCSSSVMWVATANHLSPPIPIFCILNTCTH